MTRLAASPKTATATGPAARSHRILVILLCGLTVLVVFRHSPPQVHPKNSSKRQKAITTPAERQCAQHEGYIIANMHGRLANNLFQIAMANRLAEELCWPVIYKEGWQGVFPHDARAKQCFPHGMAIHQRQPNEPRDQRWFDAMQIAEATKNGWATPERFFQSVPHRMFYQDYDQWLKHSMDKGTSLQIGALHEFDYTSSTGWDNNLVHWLRHPGNKTFQTNLQTPTVRRRYDTVRTVHLNFFFISYKWMEPWMPQIRQWHAMNEPECCRHVPPDNAVVIHIRNFAREGEQFNPHFADSVYWEVLDRFYFGPNAPPGHVLWIVCQPQDTEIPLVQTLQQRYSGTLVVTGDDPFDAFCTLRKAKNLVLSTSSTFSQMAALLAEEPDNTNVHYLLPKLQYPPVTLAVPHWNYHLVNSNNNKSSIQRWNVPFQSITPNHG